MKFITFENPLDQKPRFGFIMRKRALDILKAAEWLQQTKGKQEYMKIPGSLKSALADWENHLSLLQNMEHEFDSEDLEKLNLDNNPVSYSESTISLLAPVPDPPSFRDFYAFEQHVRAARKLRGLDMNPDWFRLPIFYFSNPNALYGHGADIPYPDHTEELDFELEFAVIIAQGGSNIKAHEAQKFIGGYTVLNDWSSRDLQREEMPMSLGPAKGKDFASSFGPYMVTPDELESAWDEEGKLQLRMTCHVNGKLISDGNTNDLYHSFPKIIERASMNTKLVPGDCLGSGTVGTGCILELRPENTGGWLKRGDLVRLEVERLGVLENKIV